jgi:hypothetical protein
MGKLRSFLIVVLLAMPACGGGGSSPTSVAAPPPTTTTTSSTSTTVTTTSTTSSTARVTTTTTPQATCDGVAAPNRCDVGSGSPPATARCNDGLWSCSATRQGTCSSHGGVACWVCPGPLC